MAEYQRCSWLVDFSQFRLLSNQLTVWSLKVATKWGRRPKSCADILQNNTFTKQTMPGMVRASLAFVIQWRFPYSSADLKRIDGKDLLIYSTAKKEKSIASLSHLATLLSFKCTNAILLLQKVVTTWKIVETTTKVKTSPQESYLSWDFKSV